MEVIIIMNYLQIEKTSVANGPGVRVVLWVAGCKRHCPGCQNRESWDLNSGELFDEAAKQELFESLGKPYIKGLTLSGGHPLEPENVADVYKLVVEIKSEFPNKDIWLYTGYTLDIFNLTALKKGISPDCIHYNTIHKILNMCDVIVDGPYIEEQRDITLPFRGSKNQRLIDVKETIKQNKIVQYKIN